MAPYEIEWAANGRQGWHKSQTLLDTVYGMTCWAFKYEDGNFGRVHMPYAAHYARALPEDMRPHDNATDPRELKTRYFEDALTFSCWLSRCRSFYEHDFLPQEVR